MEVSVPRQEREWSFICVLGISILTVSTILIFDFGIVRTVRSFLFSILLLHDCIMQKYENLKDSKRLGGSRRKSKNSQYNDKSKKGQRDKR